MANYPYTEIPLFRGNDIRELFNQIAREAITEVNRTTIHEGTGLIAHNLYEKYALKELYINKESKLVEKDGTKVVFKRDDFNEQYEETVKLYRFSFKYEGTDDLLTHKPSTYTMGNHTLRTIDRSVSEKRVAYSVQLLSNDDSKVEKDIEYLFSTLFDNIDNVNKDVNQFNTELRDIIQNRIIQKRNEDSDEDDFLRRMNNK